MKPQEYLTKEGKLIFEEIVKHLPEQIEIDSFVVSQTAQCLDMLNKASAKINTKGYTQPTKNGYDVVNGDFTMWKEASNRFDKYCATLGLSPSAREKITAFSHKKDKPDIS
jgi:P27 family predicted phage terminase small subunit